MTNNEETIEKKEVAKEIVEDINNTLVFKGNTGEYFKIWIVNIILSILTIGIYSAWAKVRNNRYFYANTVYKNSPFEYLADPIKILKGRIIVVVFYVVFYMFTEIIPNLMVAGALLLIFLVFFPWLINRAIIFKLRYSAYRNISFKYNTGAKPFYIFFLINVPLFIITFGLAFPYIYNKFKKLFISNSSFGVTAFNFDGKNSKIYKIFLLSFLVLGIIPIIFFSLGFLGIVFSAQNTIIIFAVMMLLLLLLNFLAKGVFDALMANYVWSKTTLNKTTFECKWNIKTLAWIYLSNFLVIVLSFGLLIPWAKIRLMRYKIENFSIITSEIDDFIATQKKDRESLGEEVSDFFDIDIGV